MIPPYKFRPLVGKATIVAYTGGRNYRRQWAAPALGGRGAALRRPEKAGLLVLFSPQKWSFAG
jgi:hypothetical protein